MKNKKATVGGETVIWIYRFILIGLIVLGFVIVISNFYAIKYDIRPAESVLLARRITSCIAANGITKFDVLDSIKVSECAGLSKEERDEFYIKAVLSYSNSSTFAIGDPTLEPLCGAKGKYIPYCLNQKYYLLLEQDGNLERAMLDLLIAIRKFEENV